MSPASASIASIWFGLAMVWLCVTGAHCQARADVTQPLSFGRGDCAVVASASKRDCSNTAPAGSDIPVSFGVEPMAGKRAVNPLRFGASAVRFRPAPLRTIQGDGDE